MRVEVWRRDYSAAYKAAMSDAAAQGIEIKSSNPAWIAFWENYKQSSGLTAIRMHISLTENYQ